MEFRILFNLFKSKPEPNLYKIKASLSDVDGQQTVIVETNDAPGAQFPIRALDLVNSKRNMLKDFSIDDIVTICSLAYIRNKPEVTETAYLARQYKYLHIIGMVFLAGLITANLAASKIVSVFGLTLAGGLIVYPITFVCVDICTEVYGYKNARKMIWAGMLVSLFHVIAMQIAIALPAAQNWENQVAFEAIFDASARVTIASLISFLISEFVNSYALAKMKLAYKGQAIWFRVLTSSGLAMLLDCIIFKIIAFAGLIPASQLVTLILSSFVYRIIVELLFVPLTARIAKYIKYKENIDIYDINTKFTPFSMDTNYKVINNLFVKRQVSI
ncbi:queuosine precursor transporter [Spartinivicinus ruber]|uniref:queuosine precursor transporter n=1 Tax=Spartinivicinus ruber TaxID=2683272 RepID=UPI0013D396F7|nr:queuosine precursor transporter [Spartinivicinus ruber]